MRVLDRSEVLPTEIDGLGHLNVRFYMERAQRANRNLMAEIGLGPEALTTAKLMQTDSYVRYQREQFAGSALTVNGGVLKAEPGSLQLYFEVRNPAKDQIAATFIFKTELADRASGAAVAPPAGALAAAADALIELPEHGRPRTLSLAPPRLDVSFEELASRLTDDPSDPMSRSMERVVEASECDEFGFLSETQDLMFGGWRMPSEADMRRMGPMTFTSDEGLRVGWAALETRNVRVSQARAGDSLCSVGAEIGLHSKVRHSRRWMFNTSTGRLVSMNDNVAIALDLDARRPIEIPASLRGKLEGRHVPEFA